jgi:hypothetical protein
MGLGLFFLALVGGWYFNRHCTPARYYIYSGALTGYEVVLAAALTGCFLGVFPRVLTYFLAVDSPPAITAFHTFFPLEYTGTAAVALLLGVALTHAINTVGFGAKKDRSRFLSWAIAKSDDDLR